MCQRRNPGSEGPHLPERSRILTSSQEVEGGSAAASHPAQADPSSLQPVPELRAAKAGMEPEDVFERSTPEELMLGGHGEERNGDGDPRRPRSSSLSEALASESATAAMPGSKPPHLPPKVKNAFSICSQRLTLQH